MSKTLEISKHDRVMIVAPHPDDEALAAGGLIQRALSTGAKVRVLLVTNGDNNPWPQRVVERRWRIRRHDRKRWGERRQSEALLALQRLGAPAGAAQFFSLPDQGVTGLLMSADEKTIGRFCKELSGFRPTLLVTPSPDDRHPDHNAMAVLIQLALARHGDIMPRELHFLIHAKGSRPGARVTLRLTHGEKMAKRAAILAHESQMKLSRRRFTAYAKDTEIFYEPAATLGGRHDHPVRDALVGDAVLQLHLAPRPTTAAWRGARILVAIESLTEGSVRWSLPLPARSAVVRMFDERLERPARKASVRVHGGGVVVGIPLASARDAARIFVKFSLRRLFYDEAGWLEAGPVGATPPGATGRLRAALEIPQEEKAAREKFTAPGPLARFLGRLAPQDSRA
jgi:LmbE family N-acetylglucosaminyl deacetylase